MSAMKLTVSYDEQADILYMAREGEEELVEEVYPGVNLEFDRQGRLIGIEILRASQVLRDVAGPLLQKAG